MTKKTKIRILVWVVFFVIYFIIYITLHTFFKDLDASYKGMISAFLTVILAPRVKKHNTQSGTKTQITWLFMKKVISV